MKNMKRKLELPFPGRHSRTTSIYPRVVVRSASISGFPALRLPLSEMWPDCPFCTQIRAAVLRGMNRIQRFSKEEGKTRLVIVQIERTCTIHVVLNLSGSSSRKVTIDLSSWSSKSNTTDTDKCLFEVKPKN